MKTKRYLSEASVKRQVKDWLDLHKIFWWPQQTTGIWNEKKQKHIFHGKAGVPDIMAVINGKAIAIELKSTKGVQSPAQIEFQSGFEAAGGIYKIVRGIEDLEELKELRNNL